MRFGDFLEENIQFIIFQISCTILLGIFFVLISVPFLIIILFLTVWIGITVIFLCLAYLKEKKLYDNIINLTDELEDKYYIATILPKPIKVTDLAYYYALKKACKSMNDKITEITNEDKEYREYIESFVHEIKTPISSISLYCDVEKNKEIKKQIQKIDRLIEQMLFYARSENPEKDYVIKSVYLEDIVHTVLLDYQENILQNNMTLSTDNLHIKVYTDLKWVCFIFGQIIQNSIKYGNNKGNISITGRENKENIQIIFYDDGIGILDSDLPRIFEYGFTGNDRKKEYATGIGLYLCKKIADRLGIGIEISSKYQKYTEVTFTFPKTDLYFKK